MQFVQGKTPEREEHLFWRRIWVQDCFKSLFSILFIALSKDIRLNVALFKAKPSPMKKNAFPYLRRIRSGSPKEKRAFLSNWD
jgi:hypothetical protein